MRRAIGWTLGMALLSGCASVSASNMIEVRTEEGKTRVQVGDPDLYDDVHFIEESVRSRREETGFLEAQVTVKNESPESVRIEYKYDWFDRHDFEVGATAEHWEPKLIYGDQELPLQGVAPDPSAVTFRLWVRRPQEMR